MRYSHQPVIHYTMKLIARKPLFLPRQNRSEHPISVTQKGATQKCASQNKPTWPKNLGGGCIILTLTLTGCDKVKQITSQRNASVTASTTASTTAANPSINSTSQPTPVVYPINEWQQQTLANKVINVVPPGRPSACESRLPTSGRDRRRKVRAATGIDPTRRPLHRK